MRALSSMEKNMSSKYRNYQEFYSNYLGGWSFAAGDQTLTIKDVLEQEVRSKDSGTEMKLTVTFEETDLPMIINRTNADTIAKVTGSSYTGDWVGKKIVVGSSKVKAFGDVWDAIRVRDGVPKVDTGPKATEEQIRLIYDLIQAGKVKEAPMLKYYKVSQIEDLSQDQAAELIRLKSGEEGF